MQAGIPISKLQIIQNAGHLPNLEQPGIFNSAVSTFMASI
jgi:pimeloyl-ACP methyl ester carboxylesterase